MSVSYPLMRMLTKHPDRKKNYLDISRRITLLFSLFFSLPCLLLEATTSSIDQIGQELWEAQDYSAASKIYEEEKSHPLAEWRSSRVLYNLGLLRLAQSRPLEALNFFRNISPSDLSLPRFGRDLLLNEGIAYVQYAQTLPKDSFSLDQQIIFIEHSLKAFEQAKKLDCQIRQKENPEHLSSCHPSFSLESRIRTTQTLLSHIQEQKRLQWIEEASNETLATFLSTSLKEGIPQLQKLQSEDQDLFTAYAHQKLESFIFIWNVLQTRTFPSNQKEKLNQAFSFYQESLKRMQKGQFASSVEQLTQSVEALEPLIFQEDSLFRQAYLSYELLFLKERVTLSDLEALLSRLHLLEGQKKEEKIIEQIEEDVTQSLHHLKNHQPVLSHFFLLAGFTQMHSFLKKEKATAIETLQFALKQAQYMLQLLLLSEIIVAEEEEKGEVVIILNRQQTEMFSQVNPFIPRVLKEQKSQGGCQHLPWNQVIPLYDRGYRAAKTVKKELSQTPLDFPRLLANQQETIKEWQHALQLLLHPPSSLEAPSSSSPQKDVTETFRLIQEMYLEDQSQPQPAVKEWHAW